MRRLVGAVAFRAIRLRAGAREGRIAAAQDETFPQPVHKTVSAGNATGWWVGEAAAGKANL